MNIETKNEVNSASIPFEVLEKYIFTVIGVAAVTALLLAIGRDTLGEGVIALLYLMPISWVTARWGQGPGITAAVASALAFNFFFIPPYYTLYIGSLEGWLLLAIFLIVAIVVVGRVQAGYTQARKREHEAIFLYELTAAFGRTRTPKEIALTLADHLQQLYQADLVQVAVDGQEQPVQINVPERDPAKATPDLVLPILAARGLLGEVRIWRGRLPLPADEDRLLLNFMNQSALALERSWRMVVSDRIAP